MDHDLSGVRIAVLIDADNTSPKYAEAILDELAKYGTPTIKRAYGDFSSQRLQGWTRQLNARAIRAMHQNAFTTGKNSTDSALIIDAMDLLYTGEVQAFAIVSSDSDFTSLAIRLVEAGKTVYGLGQQNKTPVSLQNACTKFIGLELLGATADAPEPEAGTDAEPAPEDEHEPPTLNLQSVLTKAVNATDDDDGWSSVSAIGNHLARTHPSFDARAFGHSKLTGLLEAQPYLQTRSSGAGVQVSLKRKAPVKKAAKTAKTAKKAAATKD